MSTRVLGLPRTVGHEWKIEAGGCVVYLRPDDNGGTVIDVQTDGNRYGERRSADVWARKPNEQAGGVLEVENAEVVRVIVCGPAVRP